MNEDKKIGYAIVDMPHEPIDKIDFNNHVQLIGHVGHGKTTTLLAEVLAADKEAVVICNPEQFAEIKESRQIQKNLFGPDTYLIKAMPKEIFTMDYSPRERKLDPRININREYKLIKEKQSKLSRWERDEVIRMYENNIPG